ncbi:MAG: hypothetical protein EXQ85_03165 [Alphaproteobacteria bacterium]|nr:hypothetical protein [Alphaproteobacteria bacterium]
MRVLFLVAATLALIGAASAGATELSDFYGYWSGSGVAETERGDDAGREQRMMQVIVRPHPRGFQLCGATLRNNTRRPAQESISMSLFAPTAANGWLAFFTRETEAAQQTAWAVLAGNTLTVTSQVVDEDGNAET